jgi:hypothetical protein
LASVIIGFEVEDRLVDRDVFIGKNIVSVATTVSENMNSSRTMTVFPAFSDVASI